MRREYALETIDEKMCVCVSVCLFPFSANLPNKSVVYFFLYDLMVAVVSGKFNSFVRSNSRCQWQV